MIARAEEGQRDVAEEVGVARDGCRQVHRFETRSLHYGRTGAPEAGIELNTDCTEVTKVAHSLMERLRSVIPTRPSNNHPPELGKNHDGSCTTSPGLHFSEYRSARFCAVDAAALCASGIKLPLERAQHSVMEGDSRDNGSHGSGPSRMSRSDLMLQQQSMHRQPRADCMPAQGGNPLDLTSAIFHQLQRSREQQAWLAWQQQLVANQSYMNQLPPSPQVPKNCFLAQQPNSTNTSPPFIPRFDDAMPRMGGSSKSGGVPQMPLSFDTDSVLSTQSGFHSGSMSLPSQSDSKRHVEQPLLKTAQVGESNSVEKVGSMGSSLSPWIERMMCTEVTPTPSPSLLHRAAMDVSCVMSMAGELQSSHTSSDLPRSEKSARSSCHKEQHQESLGEADMCSDDDDMEHAPVDEKRKKRMLSNRASAQRSRQRRQERLDQLEVLTAQLRVENVALLKKASLATHVAKRFEEENKQLSKRVEKLSQELEARISKPLTSTFTAANECTSSQQTTCASSCEMAGGRTSSDCRLTHESNSDENPSISRGHSGVDTQQEENIDVVNGNFGRHGESPQPRNVSSSPSGTGARKSGKKRHFSETLPSHSTPLDTQVGFESGNETPPQLSLPTSSSPTRADTTVRSLPESEQQRYFHDVFESFETQEVDPRMREKYQMDCLEESKWLESFAECLQ